MPCGFRDIACTPSVKAAQAANGSDEFRSDFKGHREFDRLTAVESEFIAHRDTFYMATVSETGWPYIQHRAVLRASSRCSTTRRLGSRTSEETGNTSASATSVQTTGQRSS
jgi:hypothetical protein